MTDAALKDRQFNLHMASDQDQLGITLNGLRLKAFKSNSPTDRQAYFDALSVAFQRGDLVSAAAALSTHLHPVETVKADVQPVSWRARETDEDYWYYYNRNPLHYQMLYGHEPEPLYSKATVTALLAERDEWRTLCKVGSNIEELAVETSAEALQRAENAETVVSEQGREIECLNDIVAACQREKEGLREAAKKAELEISTRIRHDLAVGGMGDEQINALVDTVPAIVVLRAALSPENGGQQ